MACSAKTSLLLALAVTSAVCVFAPRPAAANNPKCCFADGIAPICTPIDTPLRWYFIPRRPAWGPSEYCYTFREPRECMPCCLNQPLPPELVDQYEPWEFQRLGQIPGDPLLGAAAAAGP